MLNSSMNPTFGSNFLRTLGFFPVIVLFLGAGAHIGPPPTAPEPTRGGRRGPRWILPGWASGSLDLLRLSAGFLASIPGFDSDFGFGFRSLGF